MWFEILPSFGIITVALALPGFAIYHIQNAWIDNVSIKLKSETFRKFYVIQKFCKQI